MRTTKTISITLPPEMFKRAEKIARQEDRTMSELIREALRHYERQRWWSDMQAYGRPKAAAAGVKSEKDIVSAIREWRRSKRAAPDK